MKPDKWAVEELKLFDPKCRLVWGLDSRYGLPFWVIEREVSPSFYPNWEKERMRALFESGADMGPRPTHEIVLVIKDDLGNRRPFSRIDLNWMRANDCWRNFKNPQEYAKAMKEARNKYEEYQKEKRLDNVIQSWREHGYRFNYHSDGNLHISRREMSKPISEVRT